MDGVFPKISPDGKHVISGSGNLYLDEILYIPAAISGTWLNNEEFLYRTHEEGNIRHRDIVSGRTTELFPRTSWVEGSNGRFVYQSALQYIPSICTWDGKVFEGFGGAMRSCSIAHDGRIVMVRNSDGGIFTVAPGESTPERVSIGSGKDVFTTSENAYWESGGRIWQYNYTTKILHDITLNSKEYWPIVRGEWICTHTEDRLQVRKLGTSLGYVVQTGDTYYPDFVKVGDNLHFAWSYEGTKLGTRTINIKEQMVDLREPLEEPAPAQTLVENVHEFFVPTFCRTNSHPVASFYDSTTKTTTFMKFDNPVALEQYRQEEDGIHLIYDNTDGKNKPWRLEPNLWIPKAARIGDYYKYDQAILYRANMDGSFAGSHKLPYHIFVRSLTKNVKTPFGYVEALAIEFILSPKYKERFHYARHHGWFRWEMIEDGKLKEVSLFDLPYESSVTPSTPVDIPSEPEKPPMAEYKDEDYAEFVKFLDEKYKIDLGRSVEDTYVDPIGRGRWMHDYIRERDKGLSHVNAMKVVNERINEIVNLPPGTSPFPFPEPTSKMVGKLEFNKGWLDGSGYYTPILCHFGEAFSLWCRDKDKVRTALDAIRSAGYDGIRTWITLNVGTNEINYWKGREVSPIKTPNYYQELENFILTCFNEYALHLHLACGDLSGFTDSQENALFDNLAEVLKKIPDDAILLIEGLNEARDTGDPDDTHPSEIERLINRIRTKHPQHLYALSAYTGTEEREDLTRWTPDWMPFFLVHGYRGGHVYDKVRHIFSLTYEDPVRKWGWQGEPTGPGEYVSATSNKEELDSHSLAMMACMSLMTGQVWCYMSSPGVIYDEPFQYMQGFQSVPLVRDWLPRDISQFTDRFHGGTAFAHKRIFAVPGTDETRADHVVHPDGRFVVLLYGPNWKNCQKVKDCSIEKEYDFGKWGKAICGRL